MMLDTRQRLASHLYPSAIDISPDAAVALRIGHASGLTWRVQGDRLYLTIGGQEVPPISLAKTIEELAAELESLGVIVRYVNNDFRHLSALSLINGSGSDRDSNSDQLKAFTSNLWVILDAYAVELDEAERQIGEAIAQLYLGTAEGEILDYWSEFFGVPRSVGESDDDFRKRIIVEILRPKSNGIALENAASEIIGERVQMYEPWTDLLYLSESNLDAHHTYDGGEWSPHVFRPIYRGRNNIKWHLIIPVLERLRPAGVKMLDPEWVPDTRHIDAGDILRSHGTTIEWLSEHRARYADRVILGEYYFGDEVVNNYKFSSYDLHTIMSLQGANGFPFGLRPHVRFVRAQAVLSEPPEVGDEHCMFRMFIRYATNIPFLGSFCLSDFDPGIVEALVEDVIVGFRRHNVERNRRTDSVIDGYAPPKITQDWHIGKYITQGNAVLGEYRFGDEVARNYNISRFDVVAFLSQANSRFPFGLFPHVGFVRAQVVLSDQSVFGDEHCMFPKYVRYSTNVQRLDEFALSDFDPGIVDEVVEEVTLASLASGLSLPDREFGITCFCDEVIGVELGMSPASAIVDGAVVTQKFISEQNIVLSLEYRNPQPLGWYGSWREVPWNHVEMVGGFVIKSTTETV